MLNWEAFRQSGGLCRMRSRSVDVADAGAEARENRTHPHRQTSLLEKD
jgi:hypothetical protein